MEKRNVILVTIDTLRRDFLGCYGYPKNISPNIDKLAKEGILFENAYANGPNTPHAFKSIMMGKLPLDDPGYGIFEKGKYLPLLFKKHGYLTIGIEAYNPILSRYFGYNKGFDVFVDFMDRYVGHNEKSRKILDRIFKKSLYLIRKLIFKFGDRFYIHMFGNLYNLLGRGYNFNSMESSYLDVLKKLNDIVNYYNPHIKQKGVFLWVHFMDVHWPYSKPNDVTDGEYRAISDLIRMYQNPKYAGKRKISNKTLLKIRKMYEQSIIDVDMGIEKLLTILKKYQLIKNSTLFIMSDHGEYLGEHSMLEHQYSIFNELLQIPLIIWENNSSKGCRVYADSISQCDIYELILKSRYIKIFDLPLDNMYIDKWIISNVYVNRDSGRMYIYSDNVYANLLNLENIAGRIYSIIFKNMKLVYDSLKSEYTAYNLNDDPNEQNPKDGKDSYDLIKIINKHISQEKNKRKISKHKYELDTMITQIAWALYSKKSNISAV